MTKHLIKKIKRLLLLVLLFQHLCCFAQNDATALNAFKAGNYDQAAKLYGSLYVDKGNAKYRTMLDKAKQCIIDRKEGFRAIVRGNYGEAVEHFNKILAVNPDDIIISEKLKEIKPWVDNAYLAGSLIFHKGEGLYLAVLPIPEGQRKCNRDEARDESIKCQHGGLMDWRIPSMEEMKIILREIPSDQLGGEVFWFGNYDRVCRIRRDPRTNVVISKEYIQYNATCMDKNGRYIRTDKPTYLANYFLVRDFTNDCVSCPVTVYEETR